MTCPCKPYKPCAACEAITFDPCSVCDEPRADWHRCEHCGAMPIELLRDRVRTPYTRMIWTDREDGSASVAA